MPNIVVQEIYNKDRSRRVFIYRREDGLFSYEPWYYSEDEYEMCWIGQRCSGLYDSQETAIREAQANVDWLVTEAELDAAQNRASPVEDVYLSVLTKEDCDGKIASCW